MPPARQKRSTRQCYIGLANSLHVCRENIRSVTVSARTVTRVSPYMLTSPSFGLGGLFFRRWATYRTLTELTDSCTSGFL